MSSTENIRDTLMDNHGLEASEATVFAENIKRIPVIQELASFQDRLSNRQYLYLCFQKEVFRGKKVPSRLYVGESKRSSF